MNIMVLNIYIRTYLNTQLGEFLEMVRDLIEEQLLIRERV